MKQASLIVCTSNHCCVAFNLKILKHQGTHSPGFKAAGGPKVPRRAGTARCAGDVFGMAVPEQISTVAGVSDSNTAHKVTLNHCCTLC